MHEHEIRRRLMSASESLADIVTTLDEVAQAMGDGRFRDRVQAVADALDREQFAVTLTHIQLDLIRQRLG